MESKGEKGERLAADYLRKHGLRILERNYRFERGEVDLVCEDGDEIVFVEVKARHSSSFGEPEEAVTESKQERLRKVAEGYCQERELEDRYYRFDIISVHLGGDHPAIEHFKDAF